MATENCETDIEKCYRCGKDANTGRGVIYVRDKNPITDRYDNMAVCKDCWNKEHPEKPYRE